MPNRTAQQQFPDEGYVKEQKEVCPSTNRECPVYDTKGAVQECCQEVEFMGLLECPEEA